MFLLNPSEPKKLSNWGPKMIPKSVKITPDPRVTAAAIVPQGATNVPEWYQNDNEIVAKTEALDLPRGQLLATARS